MCTSCFDEKLTFIVHKVPLTVLYTQQLWDTAVSLSLTQENKILTMAVKMNRREMTSYEQADDPISL